MLWGKLYMVNMGVACPREDVRSFEKFGSRCPMHQLWEQCRTDMWLSALACSAKNLFLIHPWNAWRLWNAQIISLKKQCSPLSLIRYWPFFVLYCHFCVLPCLGICVIGQWLPPPTMLEDPLKPRPTGLTNSRTPWWRHLYVPPTWPMLKRPSCNWHPDGSYAQRRAWPSGPWHWGSAKDVPGNDDSLLINKKA